MDVVTEPEVEAAVDEAVEVETGARVYRYGALEPTVGLDLVEDQLRLAHRYRNRLVELELDRRRAVNSALTELAPELVAVERRIGEKARRADPESGVPAAPATGLVLAVELAKAAARAARAAKRSRVPADRELAQRLKALRAELAGARAQRSELRAATFADPAWEASQERIEAAHVAAGKAARAACGLYWGTYLAVEKAARSFRRGAPPRFRPWRLRKDRLAVQFQGGLPAGDLLAGADPRLRLVRVVRPERRCDGCMASARRDRRGQPHPADARSCTCAALPPPSKHRAEHAEAWFRVRSDEAGRPTWARVPVALHRLPPDDAAVKWAYLLRRRVGVHDRWTLHLVLQRDSWDPGDRAESGRVGVDVGWRVLPDGALRVATWAGSDGREGEVALPAWWLREARRVEGIRSARDRAFDVARAALATALRAAGDALPDWLLEARSTMHAWKAPARLAALALRVRREAPALPPAVAQDLEAWRVRDRHLLCFEAHLRDQLQGSRRDLYRVAAAHLSRDYAEAVLEDLDLREFHVLPPVEDGETATDDRIKLHVRDACLSELVAAIEGRFRRSRRVDPAATTTTCHACGVDDPTWTDHAARVHACAECGARWDQDVNAARNLLAASGTVVKWTRDPLAAGGRWSYAPGPNARRRVTEAAREALADGHTSDDA